MGFPQRAGGVDRSLIALHTDRNYQVWLTGVADRMQARQDTFRLATLFTGQDRNFYVDLCVYRRLNFRQVAAYYTSAYN